MPLPRDPTPDSSIALLRDGYTFASRRAARLGTDAFRARVMLQEAVIARGEEAARVFYERGRMTRRRALPPTTVRLLQDKGSVQLLDDGAHAHRKAMFLGLATADARRGLTERVEEMWRERIPRWGAAGEVVLHAEVRAVLCRAVCDWAGVPLPEHDEEKRTEQLGAMIDGAASLGPSLARSLVLRRRAERWAREVVEAVRSGALAAPDDAPVAVIGLHRDEDGELLPVEAAAVELLNVLRPTVAVARFITFAALALHEHVDRRPDPADEGQIERFVQEVRRYYPFFPMVGGRVREPFDWRGHHFEKGSWMLLDIYGTHHDPRIWDAPEMFRPERFESWGGSPFQLIAQGGGDHESGHRCPGEWTTIELVELAVVLLLTSMDYEVPPQHLHIDLSRMPALPASGVVVAQRSWRSSSASSIASSAATS